MKEFLSPEVLERYGHKTSTEQGAEGERRRDETESGRRDLQQEDGGEEQQAKAEREL